MTNNPLFNREILTVNPANAPQGQAIQNAIDTVSRRGGGTVVVKAGRYELFDTIRLASDVRLVGDGTALLTRPQKLAASNLRCDVDVGQFVFSPEDVSVFTPGMGVCFHDQASRFVHQADPLRITRIEANDAHLHEMVLSDRLAQQNAVALNYFPLILGKFADRACVENLTLDGSVESTPITDALWSYGLYLYRSRMCTVRGLTVRNVRGDGICFGKASLHTTVEDCDLHDNQNYGIHPGSHSARCAVRRCKIHGNGSDGLYICWGISHSVFEDNDIHDNGKRLWRSGIAIGHKDTDNLIARNRVYSNAKFGICVREKTAANGAHRNVFADNIIENNGLDPAGIPQSLRYLPPETLIGCGVYINGVTDGLTFSKNTIRETRSDPHRYQRHAFIIDKDVTHLRLIDNQMSGHPEVPILDRYGALTSTT
jgi:hypothetical protein